MLLDYSCQTDVNAQSWAQRHFHSVTQSCNVCLWYYSFLTVLVNLTTRLKNSCELRLAFSLFIYPFHMIARRTKPSDLKEAVTVSFGTNLTTYLLCYTYCSPQLTFVRCYQTLAWLTPFSGKTLQEHKLMTQGTKTQPFFKMAAQWLTATVTSAVVANHFPAKKPDLRKLFTWKNTVRRIQNRNKIRINQLPNQKKKKEKVELNKAIVEIQGKLLMVPFSNRCILYRRENSSRHNIHTGIHIHVF